MSGTCGGGEQQVKVKTRRNESVTVSDDETVPSSSFGLLQQHHHHHHHVHSRLLHHHCGGLCCGGGAPSPLWCCALSCPCPCPSHRRVLRMISSWRHGAPCAPPTSPASCRGGAFPPLYPCLCDGGHPPERENAAGRESGGGERKKKRWRSSCHSDFPFHLRFHPCHGLGHGHEGGGSVSASVAAEMARVSGGT